MEQEYYSLLTSAPTQDGAKKIATSLVEKRLVSGLQVQEGATCYYWWHGKVVEKIYYNISGFTLKEMKERIDDSYPQFFEWVRQSIAQ